MTEIFIVLESHTSECFFLVSCFTGHNFSVLELATGQHRLLKGMYHFPYYGEDFT